MHGLGSWNQVSGAMVAQHIPHGGTDGPPRSEHRSKLGHLGRYRPRCNISWITVNEIETDLAKVLLAWVVIHTILRSRGAVAIVADIGNEKVSAACVA